MEGRGGRQAMLGVLWLVGTPLTEWLARACVGPLVVCSNPFRDFSPLLTWSPRAPQTWVPGYFIESEIGQVLQQTTPDRDENILESVIGQVLQTTPS